MSELRLKPQIPLPLGAPTFERRDAGQTRDAYAARGGAGGDPAAGTHGDADGRGVIAVVGFPRACPQLGHGHGLQPHRAGASSVCLSTLACVALSHLRTCVCVFTHTRLCGEQVKVQELQGAIRDTSATLQDVEAQLEKAKADLLEHEADYLLRQIAAEHVDEVARKQVTEVSAAPAPAPATLSSLRAKCSGRGARPWR